MTASYPVGEVPDLPTIAPAFRQVDALTGRIAELERNVADAEAQRDDWCDRCADALRERDIALAERDLARSDLATARALGSRQGW